MTFFPRGLKAGLLISGVSLLLFLALVILRAEFDRRQRRAAAGGESASPVPEMSVPAENDGLVPLTDGTEAVAAPPAEEAPAAETPVSEMPAPETPTDGQAES